MRDTLICEDIDIASELGYNQNKRHRCVTLNGELIELTGAMSGGGKPK